MGIWWWKRSIIQGIRSWIHPCPSKVGKWISERRKIGKIPKIHLHFGPILLEIRGIFLPGSVCQERSSRNSEGMGPKKNPKTWELLEANPELNFAFSPPFPLLLPLFPMGKKFPKTPKSPFFPPRFSQEFSSSTESLDKSLAPVSSVPVFSGGSLFPPRHFLDFHPLWNFPAFRKIFPKNQKIPGSPPRRLLGKIRSGWIKPRKIPFFPPKIHLGMRKFPFFPLFPRRWKRKCCFSFWNLAPKISSGINLLLFFSPWFFFSRQSFLDFF